MAQGNGRDHHMKGFSGWLCGSGIRGGITIGRTDDLGYTPSKTSSKFTIFTPRSSSSPASSTTASPTLQGRDFRLTDVSGSRFGDRDLGRSARFSLWPIYDVGLRRGQTMTLNQLAAQTRRFTTR